MRSPSSASLPGGDARVLAIQADLATGQGRRRRGDADRGDVRRPRHPRQQRRVGQGRRDHRHDRRRMAGSLRPDAGSGDSRVADGGAPHAPPRRRFDCDDRVDLGSRIRRTNDLQRGESRRNQPRQVDGSAAGARQYPRQQRRAGVDSVSGWVVGSAAAGRSCRGSPTSWPGNCRSEGLAAPRKWGRSSRFLPRRAPAGSAGQVCPLTAASHAPRSDLGTPVVGPALGASRAAAGEVSGCW